VVSGKADTVAFPDISGIKFVMVFQLFNPSFRAVENITLIIRINWDVEPSGYVENPDNWIILWKKAILAVSSGKKFYKRLF